MTRKYKLSDILFSMNPCSEATEWVTHHMHFETLEGAVRACPRYSWLFWVIVELDDVCDEGRQLYTGAEVFLSSNALVGIQDFLLRPDNLERFACALIERAKQNGIEPT